jgi:hypothetical protein
VNHWVNQVQARVSPFQGWGGFWGLSFQGVALGYCLIAPLARQFVASLLARESLRRRGKTHQPEATPLELGHPTIHQP